jgi:hypothetical protein
LELVNAVTTSHDQQAAVVAVLHASVMVDDEDRILDGVRLGALVVVLEHLDGPHGRSLQSG